MKKFVRLNSAFFYLVLFLMMIVPALFLFPAAQAGSKIVSLIFLGMVILANLAAVFPIKFE